MKGLARHSTCECRCGGRPTSAPDVPPAMNPGGLAPIAGHPALDCVVSPDSLEQLHLSHLLVSHRVGRLAITRQPIWGLGLSGRWGYFRRSKRLQAGQSSGQIGRCEVLALSR
jgi:hypothetical protein